MNLVFVSSQLFMIHRTQSTIVPSPRRSLEHSRRLARKLQELAHPSSHPSPSAGLREGDARLSESSRIVEGNNNYDTGSNSEDSDTSVRAGSNTDN
jgi:hypothetical protein